MWIGVYGLNLEWKWASWYLLSKPYIGSYTWGELELLKKCIARRTKAFSDLIDSGGPFEYGSQTSSISITWEFNRNTEPQTYGKDLLDQILGLSPKNIKVWEMQPGSTRETGWIDDRLSPFGLLDPFFFLPWEEPVKGGQEAEDSTWCLCKFLLGASKNSGWIRG